MMEVYMFVAGSLFTLLMTELYQRRADGNRIDDHAGRCGMAFHRAFGQVVVHKQERLTLESQWNADDAAIASIEARIKLLRSST